MTKLCFVILQLEGASSQEKVLRGRIANECDMLVIGAFESATEVAEKKLIVPTYS